MGCDVKAKIFEFSIINRGDSVSKEPCKWASELYDASTYPGILLIWVSRASVVGRVAPSVRGIELVNVALPIGFGIFVVIHFLVLEEKAGITEVGGDKLTS